MSKIANPTKVITGVNTRWSYANVWDPKSINGGAPKYSVSLIIPKSDTVTVNKIKAAIQAAYEEGESSLREPLRFVLHLMLSRLLFVTVTRSVLVMRLTRTATSSTPTLLLPLASSMQIVSRSLIVPKFTAACTVVLLSTCTPSTQTVIVESPAGLTTFRRFVMVSL